VGVLVAFALWVQRFFEPIRQLTMQYSQLQRAMAAGVRIFELLDVQPEVQDTPGAPEMPTIKGDIRFDHVSFHYVPGMEVLQDINLHIRPGDTVALVGATGAGKSTLATLRHRFAAVTPRRITIDGFDIRRCGASRWCASEYGPAGALSVFRDHQRKYPLCAHRCERGGCRGCG
jgi:ABC-type multidrug transport system fused ATPase/permease subunit